MASKLVGRDGAGLTTAGVSSGELSAESQRITNLAAASSSGDAVSKSHLEGYAVPLADLGAANGVAELGADSKVPDAQLNRDSIYSVADIAARDALTGLRQGDVVAVADAGSGVSRNYQWNGAAFVELPHSVNSVNTQVGAVVLDTDDVGEGATNLYYTQGRFDSAFTAKDSDDLSQGATNLYFTEAGVRGTDLAGLASFGTIEDTDTVLQAFQKTEDSIGKTFEYGVAGEAMAADELWFLRRGYGAEIAGRYYKAQADTVENSRVVGYVLLTSAVIAGDTIKVYKAGEANLGPSDTAFVSGDLVDVVYLNQAISGKFTLAPTVGVGDIQKPLGFVGDLSIVDFQPLLHTIT